MLFLDSFSLFFNRLFLLFEFDCFLHLGQNFKSFLVFNFPLKLHLGFPTSSSFLYVSAYYLVTHFGNLLFNDFLLLAFNDVDCGEFFSFFHPLQILNVGFTFVLNYLLVCSHFFKHTLGYFIVSFLFFFFDLKPIKLSHL